MMLPAEKWEEQARYDLDTARAMLDSGRYLYVLFCCQQAVEKALKGVVVERTSKFPPRLHSLQRLAKAAEVVLEPSVEDFLGELSSFYIQTRYPEEIESIGASVTRDIAQETFRETEKVLEWLLSMLK